VSGETTGHDYGLEAIVDGKAAHASGVEHAEELVALAEAMVGSDDAALASARQVLQDAMGAEALVDAAAVASNFERMVRIADATGIPLDPPVNAMTADIQEELGLTAFGAKSQTPDASRLARAAGPLLRRMAPRLMRALGPRLQRLTGAPRD
jgi:hypothetical protein